MMTEHNNCEPTNTTQLAKLNVPILKVNERHL